MSEIPSYATPTESMRHTRTSAKAITSLVLGILLCIPVLTSLAAILFAIAAIRTTRDPLVRGRGMAIAGLVLGICGMVLWSTIGAFTIFLLIASQPPRAVLTDFAADLGRNDLPAATALCDPTTFKADDLDGVHKYITPFGTYLDQTCTSVNLRSTLCVLSGTMRFSTGSHIYTATLMKTGSDWKIWGFHIY
jgi:hypothetical protein